MLLNVLKGAYPSLQQISKDHLMKTGIDFERGACLVEITEGEETIWKVAEASDAARAGAVVHFSLHGSDDRQAMQAGRLGATGYTAKVSALSCIQPMEIETDMFEGEPEVGDYLTVTDGGKLTKAAADGTQNVCAQVTKACYYRWGNNLPAEGIGGDWRQGTARKVIAARTVFIPAK